MGMVESTICFILWFPMANENKWLSKGTLKIADEVVEEGWSIHEYVDFK